MNLVVFHIETYINRSTLFFPEVGLLIICLFQPPGAGKTFLVKQMSKECEMPLFGVHTHQVENADSVSKLFVQARENYPSFVFLDDVDSVFANHDQVKEGFGAAPIQDIRSEIFSQLGPRKLRIYDPKSTHNPTQQEVSIL